MVSPGWAASVATSLVPVAVETTLKACNATRTLFSADDATWMQASCSRKTVRMAMMRFTVAPSVDRRVAGAGFVFAAYCDFTGCKIADRRRLPNLLVSFKYYF